MSSMPRLRRTTKSEDTSADLFTSKHRPSLSSTFMDALDAETLMNLLRRQIQQRNKLMMELDETKGNLMLMKKERHDLERKAVLHGLILPPTHSDTSDEEDENDEPGHDEPDEKKVKVVSFFFFFFSYFSFF